MRFFLQGISLLALAFTVVPSILFLSGAVELDGVKFLMLISTIVWFVATPLWMDKKENA